MSWKNTEERYGSLSIGLHWLTLILIVLVYCTMEFRGVFPKGTPERDLMKQAHFIIGLSIFALTFLRIAARAIAPAPRIVPAIPQWQAIPAKLVHLALYALMLGAPLAGWLILSGEAKPIPLGLPALIEKNHSLAETVEHYHVLAAEIGYWLIGLHAAAAIFHKHVVKDNTLERMLPQRGNS